MRRERAWNVIARGNRLVPSLSASAVQPSQAAENATMAATFALITARLTRQAAPFCFYTAAVQEPLRPVASSTLRARALPLELLKCATPWTTRHVSTSVASSLCRVACEIPLFTRVSAKRQTIV